MYLLARACALFVVPHPKVGLQWGRGQMTAESLGGLAPRTVQALASMGPRSDDRGETRTGKITGGR